MSKQAQVPSNPVKPCQTEGLDSGLVRAPPLQSPLHQSGVEMELDSNQLLNARQAAEYLGISLSTLGRVEREGNLIPFRTP